MRGHYDEETIFKALDEGFLAHVGFCVEGQAFVIPTIYGRKGDKIYLHGSAAGRMMKSLAAGLQICLTVTHVDGLVLSRSAFHHSINYRSVVLFGKAQEITEPSQKSEALRIISEHLIRGRWNEVREPSLKELKGTVVLELPITEASAKVRTGPAMEEPEDLSREVWAGVLPLSLLAGQPVADDHILEGIAVPEYLKSYGSKG